MSNTANILPGVFKFFVDGNWEDTSAAEVDLKVGKKSFAAKLNIRASAHESHDLRGGEDVTKEDHKNYLPCTTNACLWLN